MTFTSLSNDFTGQNYIRCLNDFLVGWRNWQTRTVQGRMAARLWGFNSPTDHHFVLLSMTKPEKPVPPKISNREARHAYHILESFEAGIALKGPEVKSLRAGKASLQDSFARVERGEVFLYNMHITPYTYTHHEDLSPTRTRKLLLHRSQIHKLEGRVQEKGLTLIPLDAYFTVKGHVKINLAIAKGKKGPDKRDDLKRRDIERETRREFRGRAKF